MGTVMDDQRPVNVSRISDKGWQVCKCGRFSVILTNEGKYQIIDTETGDVLHHLNKDDVADLCQATSTLEEWSNYHKITR